MSEQLLRNSAALNLNLDFLALLQQVKGSARRRKIPEEDFKDGPEGLKYGSSPCTAPCCRHLHAAVIRSLAVSVDRKRASSVVPILLCLDVFATRMIEPARTALMV